MRYMLLIHHDEKALAAAPQQQLWADYAAFNEALAKAGGQSGERLGPGGDATVVRVSGERSDILDGPYADTREQLAGYFFIEADSLEDAVTWARRCPSARYGAIEIRPVIEQARK